MERHNIEQRQEADSTKAVDFMKAFRASERPEVSGFLLPAKVEEVDTTKYPEDALKLQDGEYLAD